jgi:hypothetical protein
MIKTPETEIREIKIRIDLLKSRLGGAVVNEKIIKKLERRLRKLES